MESVDLSNIIHTGMRKMHPVSVYLRLNKRKCTIKKGWFINNF